VSTNVLKQLPTRSDNNLHHVLQIVFQQTELVN